MAPSDGVEQLSVPTTGMRGGLGRRLLTALLVMTIGPLSALSWYAARSGRRDVQRHVMDRLTTVATATELRVRDWVDSRVQAVEILATGPALRENSACLGGDTEEAEQARLQLQGHLDAFLTTDRAFTGISFLNPEGEPVVSAGTPQGSTDIAVDPAELAAAGFVFEITSLDKESESGAFVVQSVESSRGGPVGTLVGWITLDGLEAILSSVGGVGQGGQLYLVGDGSMALPLGELVEGEGIDAALSGEEAKGRYQNHRGMPVIGVYRAMPDLGLVLAAEQPEDEAFSPAERVTAAIVAAALVVALVASVIAAVVTRQITGPVVRLTESALHIAKGDLDQRVHVDSRDEIGILANVFNQMVAELGSLYDGLEAKVARRTALLREANFIIQRHAVQLTATVEISRVVASILDAGALLQQVVHLVQDQFGYHYVGVYLLDEDDGEAKLKAGTGGDHALEAAKASRVTLGDGTPVSKAALSREPVVEVWNQETAETELSTPLVRAEVALPLSVREEVLGVLDILTVKPEGIDQDTLSVLSSVASQVAIALDNARVYRNEREARERLKHAEEMRSRFLSHMSRELREPLTNITGFCRLILNGLDGPISDLQRQDLQIILANSEHLLGLINDLLDVSQIEAGLMELHFQELDLQAMIKSVMATASALVRDRDIQLIREVDELPPLKADAARMRQVLLKLLTNAAKFTEAGTITVRAWSEDHRVFVSVSDTGNGIPLEDQKRIFEQFEQGTTGARRRPNGAGLGLALSKQFVEMHGGRIWVESAVGIGSTFTFSLPLEPVSV